MRTAKNDSEYLRPPEEFPPAAAQSEPLPPEFGGGSGGASAKKKKRKYHWLAAALAAGLLSTVAMFGDTAQEVLTIIAPQASAVVEATAAPSPTPALSPAPTAAPTPSPTPAPTPVPQVETVFYRTSEVYHGRVELTSPRSFAEVTIRFVSNTLGETIWEYSLTEEDLAAGFYAFSDYNLMASDFVQDRWKTLELVNFALDPVLEVVCTLQDGSTFAQQIEPMEELWISVRYDLADPAEDFMAYFLGEKTYPDCFVVRIDRTTLGKLNIRWGEDMGLPPGDVAVTVAVDGRVIPLEGCRMEVESEKHDGETYYWYAYILPRPADFPEHGEAVVTFSQRLLNFDLTVVRTRTIEY